MSGKPSGGLGSLFGGLFSPEASKQVNAKYQRVFERAARKLSKITPVPEITKKTERKEGELWIN